MADSEILQTTLDDIFAPLVILQKTPTWGRVVEARKYIATLEAKFKRRRFSNRNSSWRHFDRLQNLYDQTILFFMGGLYSLIIGH